MPTIRPRSRPARVSAGGVIKRQDNAAQRLAAHPGREDAVHLARLGANHVGVAMRQPGIDHADHARPVAQQVEPDNRCHHCEGQHVEDREAGPGDAGERPGDEAQHIAGLAADQIAQLVVYHVGAEVLLQIREHRARPTLQQLHVLRDTAEQQADLLQDERVEQQREQQDAGDQPQDHQQRRQPAAKPQPGKPRRGRVEHVGDAGGGDKRRQHRGEELQGKPRHHQQPDDQCHPLTTCRLARGCRHLGEPGPRCR